MTLFKNLAICLFSALFVTACQHDGQDLERKAWETKVERHSHFENLYFGSSQTHMNRKQHQNLRDLVSKATLDTHVYARLLMNVPKTRANDLLQIERVRQLSRHLKLYGIESYRVEVTYLAPHKVATASRKNKNMITVVIDQYEVHLPQCPGWDVMGDKTLPQGESQFGCVTERNFANMLAEPKDLYEAQPVANRDGPFNAATIDAYRSGGEGSGGDTLDTSSIESVGGLAGIGE